MTGWELLAVVLLVALNAFFVMAEYALVRSRRPALETLEEEGARGARLALVQVDHISEYISACQVGITMSSIGIGALGEPTVAHVLRPALGGPLSHALAVALAVALAYLIITSVHIVIGEIVPKIYAIDHAETLARRLARPLQWFRVAFHPFIVVLTGVSNRILRLVGVDPEQLAAHGSGSEELKRLIAESYAGGELDEGEAGMLRGVFHLHEQEARQVMTPIPAVVTVDVSEDVEAALRRCISAGHTRLIATEEFNPDRVCGIVHINSLARLLMTDGPEAKIEGLVRDAPIIPETKPLDDLLADLQRQRSAMAVVVDEYGRTAGIVTVEDIIEEVVGEIDDETDPAGGAVRQLANGDWFVRGHVAITDLLDYGLELPIDTDAYNSVGGLVFATLGRLPKRGDTISANGYSIRVESVRDNRVEAVRIRERRESAMAAHASDESR
ncbi:MAG TPA: hemolysin family protein [Solirubrobacteraceae bacterium]|nr:hemolysin family protein [Solirubrobacteraceae bacterium]